MPSPLPYFPFHTRDWLSSSSVLRMSPAARGVYIQLLCVQWEDGILPEDQSILAAMAGVEYPSETWKTIWLSVGSCFVKISSGLVNIRMQKDREKAMSKVNLMRENGVKGGRPLGSKKPNKNQKVIKRKANEKQNKSHTDTDIYNPIVPFDAMFAEFWGAYPRKVAKEKAREKLEIALRSTPLPEIMDGLGRYVAFLKATGDLGTSFVLHAATWLHGKRWADDHGSQSPDGQSPEDRANSEARAALARELRAG